MTSHRNCWLRLTNIVGAVLVSLKLLGVISIIIKCCVTLVQPKDELYKRFSTAAPNVWWVIHIGYDNNRSGLLNHWSMHFLYITESDDELRP